MRGSEILQDNTPAKLVYICSPLRGEIEANLKRATRYCDYAASCGVIPIAPHISWNGVFDDTIPEKRETALKLGLELLNRCDEIWVMGDEISQGMQGEIDEANRLKKPALYVLDAIVEQNMKIRQQNSPLGPEDALVDDGQNYTGRILVLKPESIKPEYRTSDHSLWVISHGPGCRPGSVTGTVHAHELFDSDYAAFHRSEFYGPVKPESLLSWFRDHPVKNELTVTHMLEVQQTQERDLSYPYLLAQCEDETLKIFPDAQNIASYVWTRSSEIDNVYISMPDGDPILFKNGDDIEPLGHEDYFREKLEPAFAALRNGITKPQPINEVRDRGLELNEPENDAELEP